MRGDWRCGVFLAVWSTVSLGIAQVASADIVVVSSGYDVKIKVDFETPSPGGDFPPFSAIIPVSSWNKDFPLETFSDVREFDFIHQPTGAPVTGSGGIVVHQNFDTFIEVDAPGSPPFIPGGYIRAEPEATAIFDDRAATLTTISIDMLLLATGADSYYSITNEFDSQWRLFDMTDRHEEALKGFLDEGHVYRLRYDGFQHVSVPTDAAEFAFGGQIMPIPEPSAFLLVLIGIVALPAQHRR